MPDQSRFRYHADEDQWWAYRDGEKYTRAEKRTCKVCREKFICIPSNAPDHCSRQCAGVTHGKTLREKRDGGPGNVYVDAAGYRQIWWPEHEMANDAGWVREHRLVASRAIGKPLPSTAVVHHVNGEVDDNRPENLVICEDASYHNELHRRLEALRACGHPGWYRCGYCGEYSPREELVMVDRSDHEGEQGHHRSCATEYMRERRNRARA